MIAKIIVILYASIIMLLVSAVGALPSLLWGMSWKNYLATFFIITAVQLFIGRLWNYFIGKRTDARLAEANAATALADAFQHVEVVCAYCGTTNLAKLLIGKDDNEFNCEACKETNRVLIETSVARTTKPIMPKQQAAEIFKNIDKD